MSFQIGDKVRIINPNNPDFGLEGVVEGIEGSSKGQWKYQVRKRESACVFKYRWAFEYEIELIKDPTIKLGKNLLDGIIINKDGIKVEGLLEFNNNNAILQPYTEIGCDAADSLRYCLENKKGEKDNMEILNIYEDREAIKIKAAYKQRIEEIKIEDAFENLRKNFIKQIEDLYKNEYNKEFNGLSIINTLGRELLTKESEEKINKAEEYKKKDLEELDAYLQEVRAQLDIIPEGNYEATIKILKKYDIIGKDGKINA